MASTATIVMAGGLGTRMRSPVPKVLHALRGRTLLEWVVAAALEAGSERVMVVVSPQISADVGARLPDLELAIQDPPLGTGHAVEVGLAALGEVPDAVVVLSGDVPAVRPETIRAAISARASAEAACALVSMTAPLPNSYGRVVRALDGSVERIVEAGDASAEELRVDEVNAGLYCFAGQALADVLARIEPHNAQGERYLTDAVALIGAEGGDVQALHEPDAASLDGVNTMIELAEVDASLRRRLCDRAMLEGVRIVDPATTHLDWSVELAPGCRIEPNTTLEGATRVGEGAQVGPYVVACDALVGQDCRVGPFAVLRPGTVMGAGAIVGRFVETKNAVLAARAKVPHLAYIGDADVGEDANVGAGTITANYDGRDKHRTVIGARARTGSNDVLVAPVTIGEDAILAAGSVITDDVPAGALAIARAHQVVKEGYVERRKRQQEGPP